MKFYRKEDIDTLRVWIDQARKPVVVSHTHPDGDALGSLSSLALLLKGLGKDVACVLSDTPADNLRFILPEEIPFFFRDQDAAAAEARIREADLIFLADANAFSRTEGLEEVLKASTARKVLMDHHLNPDTALERTNAKFKRRFTYLELRAKELGRDLNDMSLAEMDALWDEAKTKEAAE